MFDMAPPTQGEIAAAEAELDRLERVIARCRARQVELLAWLERARPVRDTGARSLEEWTAARLDVAPATARDLVAVARDGVVAVDEASFDRRVAEAGFRAAGASPEEVAAAADVDVGGLRRLTSAKRHLTRAEEREIASRRHVTLTPTRAGTAWDIRGLAPAVDGDIISRALARRADELIDPTGERVPRGQRLMDALTALAQDYLDGRAPNQHRHGGSHVTVFIDATASPRTASVAAGPTVGDDAVERVICDGATKLVALTKGEPVADTPRSRHIPPAVRDLVLQRDGGCVIDGCRSRYRLQPHHLAPWAESRDHSPDNLATVCWFHHHIAIHQQGHVIDPASPPRRRRLLSPSGPDPPAPPDA